MHLAVGPLEPGHDLLERQLGLLPPDERGLGQVEHRVHVLPEGQF